MDIHPLACTDHQASPPLMYLCILQTVLSGRALAPRIRLLPQGVENICPYK